MTTIEALVITHALISIGQVEEKQYKLFGLSNLRFMTICLEGQGLRMEKKRFKIVKLR